MSYTRTCARTCVYVCVCAPMKGVKHPFVSSSSVSKRVSFLWEAPEGGGGRKGKGGIPWIGGRERPRARRRTAGCVTQSPVHRQRTSERASGAVWIRVESPLARGGGLSRGAEYGSARAGYRAESPSARARPFARARARARVCAWPCEGRR